MTSANAQILEAYEAGLTPEQISEQFEWEPEAIKAVLMSCSKDFYQRVVAQSEQQANSLQRAPNPKIDDSLDAPAEKPLFDDFEVQTAKQAIASLVTSTEDDHIKLMAAKFVINEAKGRHDVKALAKVNINISMINDRMKRAKAAQEEAFIELSPSPA